MQIQHRFRSRPARACAGFYLVELVLVIALISLFYGTWLAAHYRDNRPNMPASSSLQKALRQSSVLHLFYERTMARAALSCNAKTRTVEGTFEFEKLDGRAPVTVAGATPCKDFGDMVVWQYPLVYAERDYDPAIVEKEFRSLLERAALKKNEDNRYNQVEEARLAEKYGSLDLEEPSHTVAFICAKAGAPYQFERSHPGQRTNADEGTLQTRCAGVHQNFELSIFRAQSETDSSTHFFVHEYNAVDEKAESAALDEYLALARAQQSQHVRHTF